MSLSWGFEVYHPNKRFTTLNKIITLHMLISRCSYVYVGSKAPPPCSRCIFSVLLWWANAISTEKMYRLPWIKTKYFFFSYIITYFQTRFNLDELVLQRAVERVLAAPVVQDLQVVDQHLQLVLDAPNLEPQAPQIRI